MIKRVPSCVARLALQARDAARGVSRLRLHPPRAFPQPPGAPAPQAFIRTASYPTSIARLAHRLDTVLAPKGLLFTPKMLERQILGGHDGASAHRPVSETEFAGTLGQIQEMNTYQKQTLAVWLFDIIDRLFVMSVNEHRSLSAPLTQGHVSEIAHRLKELTTRYDRFTRVERALTDGHVGLQSRLMGSLHSSLSQQMTVIGGELGFMTEAFEPGALPEVITRSWEDAKETFNEAHRYHTVSLLDHHYRVPTARREIAEWAFERLIGRHPMDATWTTAPPNTIAMRWEISHHQAGRPESRVLIAEFPAPSVWRPAASTRTDFWWSPNVIHDRYLQTYLRILGWTAHHRPTPTGFEVRLTFGK